jgi:hypothetical protein
MRDEKMPLKRAILFEGDYGTGKTLAAFLTAQIATANGWSFHYCRPGRDNIATVMKTARLYQPAVVFFEDVDTIAEGGDADDVSQLLDIFDGNHREGHRVDGDSHHQPHQEDRQGHVPPRTTRRGNSLPGPRHQRDPEAGSLQARIRPPR